MNVFLIADTHFGHANMVKYHGRPERFDTVIVEHWNAVVGRDDVVFHLGDVAFERDVDLSRLMERLHRRKSLCLGNHQRSDRGASPATRLREERRRPTRPP